MCPIDDALRCHASLIEDLSFEGNQFVLTARFQNDPIERRFGRYHQNMSGGRFLVSEEDIATSEKIIKIKTLVKQGFKINSTILKAKEDPVQIAKLMNDGEELISEADILQLDEASRQVSDNIAGYIVHEIEHLYKDCCQHKLVFDQKNTEFIGHLSRGGLKSPSLASSIAVSQAFALLDSCSAAMRKSVVPASKAGMKVLAKY